MSFALPVKPRDPHEPHRSATPLELLTDLCYVVAIAQAALGLHHAINHDEIGEGVLHFAIAMFAIWLAWLNFAWFNSAYDSDDVIHRLLTLLQILGSLVLAAGVPRIFEGEFVLGVAGYTIMRIGLILMWLRAAAGHPDRRQTALRYAAALTVVQTLWVLFLLVPHDVALPLFFVLALIDLSVPWWAEQTGMTPWHPHHIAERYGLMFIIVLGETILSTTVAIQKAVDAEAIGSHVLLIIVGGVLILFSFWWLYFARETGDLLTDNRVGMQWGFGHYVIFAAAAALGAGLAARVDYYDHHSEVSDLVTSAFVTGPVILFLVSLWWCVMRLLDPSVRSWGPLLVAVAVLVVATFLPYSEVWAGLVCATLLVAELRFSTGRSDEVVAHG